jgi:hypothetical protein
MATFEYHIEKTTKSMWSGKDKTDVSELLNTRGRDGWELIEVIPETTTGTLSGYHFFFKRERF